MTAAPVYGRWPFEIAWNPENQKSSWGGTTALDWDMYQGGPKKYQPRTSAVASPAATAAIRPARLRRQPAGSTAGLAASAVPASSAVPVSSAVPSWSAAPSPAALPSPA